MKYLTLKINRDILLIFIISISFSILSNAQTTNKDSVISKLELIKNIAYGTQPAWMITSAISTISGSELLKPFASSFGNTLYGRLPGLTVVQGSGEEGNDSPSLYIRGLGTFGTGGKLLVIVDGFEFAYDQLIPDEVESVTLLKDASATALFGSRAANGVLLITTKRGKEGPLKVSFSVQEGFESAMRLPNFLGSYDYASLYNEARINDGLPTLYTPDDLNAYKTGSDPFFHPDVNWYDQVLRKAAPISEYNLSFSGGQNKSRYFVLLNVLDRDGLYKNTGDLSQFSINAKYTQYNLRTNLNIDLTKRLAVVLDLGFTVADKANPVGYNTSSLFSQISLVPPNNFPVYNPNSTFGGNALYSNPWGDMLQNGFYTSNYRTFQSGFKLIEQLDMITQGLSVSAAISFNNYFRGYSSKSRTYQRYSISKDLLGNTVNTPFGTVSSSLTSSESTFDQFRNFTFQSSLNYNRTFGYHMINAQLRYDLNNYTLAGQGLPFKHVGAGGRFTYTNREKYIGEFTIGYDGSENFPKGKRFGFFPAASVGWIVSNEEFLKGNNILNYLKIRGSYGMVGNDNIGGQRFMYDQYYVGTPGFYFGTSNTSFSGYSEGTIVNPNVTWERQKELNIGLEVTLLQRLEVSLDIFRQDRYDILALPNSTVPQFLGTTLPNYNIGKVNNKGFEATIGYSSDKTKDLQFFMDVSIWDAKNKIVYNAETVQKDAYRNLTGRPIGQPFLLQAIGFFKDQPDIDASPKQIFAAVQPGDIKYKDQNNDGIIDQNDYYPIGYSNIPELTGGLHSGLKYKGFDLDMFFQCVTNCSVYLTGSNFYAFQNNGNISDIALGRWTPSTAATATYPRLSSYNNLNNYQSSSFWQRDGSFIKLRSIELGYSISEKVVKRIRLSNARVFINGTNLFSLDHMNGLTDPETLTGYPAVRSFSIGAKFQF